MKSEVAEGIKQMLSVTTPAEQIIVFGELVSTELGNSLDFYRLLVKSLPGKYSSLGATDEERNLIRLIYMHWVEVGAKIDPLQTFKDLLPVSDYFVFGDVIADFISEQLKIRELDEFVETLFGDSDLVPNSARGKLFRLLLEQNFFRGSKAKQPILAELQRFPHQTLKILNIEIDDLIPLLIEHGVIEDEEDVSKTLPLLLTNDEYLTYHCTGTSQWRKFIELIYSIEVVRTLAEKACVHLCRIQAIDRLIRERSTGSGRALFWLLHDCWKATQNINYISDAFSFFNLIGETELIAFAQTGARGKPSNLVPMAIAILQFLSHDHGSAIKILLKDLEPNKRESLRIVFQNFIVKSAWRLSETGPTACYPNDPIRESRERSKQEEVKQEYIATQMALFDRILDVNTRPSI
ncbi:MAG: hypothetical protein QG657_2063, partial [Acidobacteriota bacterium]|nr:hypothetical protein [Acidobacteriota bacterium]